MVLGHSLQMNPKISRFVKICFGDDHYGGYSVADQTEDEIDYTYQACIVKFVFIDSFSLNVVILEIAMDSHYVYYIHVN